MSHNGHSWYRLPADGRQRVISVSGGRSSGYMLKHILDAHDGDLGDTLAIFTNTGKERPETLDFVARMATEWNVPIMWLEYRYRSDAKGGHRDPKNTYETVNHNSASRSGEPFDALVRQKHMLPNQSMRTCTSELKVKTVQRYMWRTRGLNRKQFMTVLGYRHDEPRRWQKALMTECKTEWPMVHAEVTKRMVEKWWSQHSFDLGIPSWKGNCDLCFLKGKQTLLRTLREDPEAAAWWIDKENQVAKRATQRGKKDGSMARFSKRHSVADLLAEAMAQPELPLPDKDAVDCWCTD